MSEMRISHLTRTCLVAVGCLFVANGCAFHVFAPLLAVAFMAAGFNPILVLLPITLATIGTLLLFVPLDYFVMWFFLDSSETRCRRCYSILRGLERPVCPKCGTPI